MAFEKSKSFLFWLYIIFYDYTKINILSYICNKHKKHFYLIKKI